MVKKNSKKERALSTSTLAHDMHSVAITLSDKPLTEQKVRGFVIFVQEDESCVQLIQKVVSDKYLSLFEKLLKARDFKGKKKLSFEDLKREVREAGITKETQYWDEYKKHPGWLSNPDFAYKTEWRGSNDFFGKEKAAKTGGLFCVRL